MQVMSNRVMNVARDFLRLAGGDLRIVKQAMAEARRENDGAPPPRAMIVRHIRTLSKPRGRNAA